MALNRLQQLFLATLPVALAVAPAYADLPPAIGYRVEKEYGFVTINDQKILTFTDLNAHWPAARRAETVARELNRLLLEENRDPQDIHAVVDGSTYTARLGDKTVFTIDPKLAHRLKQPPLNLLKNWTSQLRLALGADPVRAVRVHGGAGKVGYASWYGGAFNGRPTASGERYNTRELTAAHRTLPFGTQVLVTNLANQRGIVVRINDRGPFGHGRIIDLSPAAFNSIGHINQGVMKVKILVMP